MLVADQVFVDDSGRRSSKLRGVGTLVMLGCLIYVAVVLACARERPQTRGARDRGRVGHIDIWTGASGAGLQACEQALTPNGPVTIEVNPPPGRPTDPRPLYPPGGTCRTPS